MNIRTDSATVACNDIAKRYDGEKMGTMGSNPYMSYQTLQLRVPAFRLPALRKDLGICGFHEGNRFLSKGAVQKGTTRWTKSNVTITVSYTGWVDVVGPKKAKRSLLSHFM